MEKEYLDKLLTMRPEELIDCKYFATGNEQLFWVALACLIQSKNRCFSEHERELLFDSASKELEGLYFVHYMDIAHETIFNQYK